MIDIGIVRSGNWMSFDYLWCWIDSRSFCDVLLYNVSYTGTSYELFMVSNYNSKVCGCFTFIIFGQVIMD